MPRNAPRVVAPRRRRPLTAVRALGALFREPERTEHVFVIIRALSGNSFEKLYRRTTKLPEAGRVLSRESSLIDVLEDRDRLRAMPEGSLGREYAAFMDAERITPGGLETASRSEEIVFYDDKARRLSERLRDSHDLWHVVTGYGRDFLGEDALLAFTYAQLRNPGVGFIAALGALRLWRYGFRQAPRVAWQGFRRGRRARPMAAVDWETLLEQPLDDVRRQLEIDAPESYPAVAAGTDGSTPVGVGAA